MKNLFVYFLLGLFLLMFSIFGYKANYFNEKDKSKELIEIELINKEIYFASIFPSPNNYSTDSIMDSYDSNYKTKKELNNSRNIIRYKIYNNTNDKIFILLNPYNLEMIGSDSDLIVSGIYYSIKNHENKGLSIHFSTRGNSRISEFEINRIDCLWKIDSLKLSNTNYKSVYELERYGNYTYINPNESIFLESYLRLPITEEPKDLFNLYIIDAFHMFNNQVYKFQLHYFIKEDDVKKRLPKEVLSKLRSENIKIVDIDLKTKIINIKPR